MINRQPSGRARKTTGVSSGQLRCPKCKTRLVRLAPQKSLPERILGIFTLYPVRCQICANRFLSFHGRHASLPKRNFHRIPVHFPTWFHPRVSSSNSQELEGTLVNLSVAGCRIESKVKLPKGSRLRLEIEISENEAPIEVKEAVVRSHIQQGIGLSFIKLRKDEKKRIGRIMYDQLSRYRSEGYFGHSAGRSWTYR